MTDHEILAKLNAIVCDILDEDTIMLTPATRAQDVDGWDSMEHINITVAAEAAFGVKFLTSEIELLQNVGDFVALIKKKLDARAVVQR